MKVTKAQLKNLIKEELSRFNEIQGAQSPQDLYERVAAATGQLEDVIVEYVESGWLENQDWGSLAENLEQTFEAMDRLRSTFASIADKEAGGTPGGNIG